jgi:hypothetical protein
MSFAIARVSASILAAVAVVALAACGESSPEVQAQQKTTLSRFKEAFGETGKLLAMKKDEIAQKMAAGLKDLDGQSAQWRAKLSTMGADAKQKLEAALVGLEQRRGEVAKGVEDLRNATPEQVEAMKKKVADAFAALQRNFADAEAAGAGTGDGR